MKIVTSIPNDSNLSGCIVLERGTKFISKQIMLHMAVYALLTGRKPLQMSHAETLIWNDKEQQMYTVGARHDGSKLLKVQDYYNQGHKLIILKPNKPVPDDMSGLLWNYAETLKYTKYQTGVFISWITYLKTGIWKSTAGDQANYCYELAARFSFILDLWWHYKSLDGPISLYDLFENPNYTAQ